eukprot:668671-Pyramimonas_sp.AAC.1
MEACSRVACATATPCGSYTGQGDAQHDQWCKTHNGYNIIRRPLSSQYGQPTTHVLAQWAQKG